MGGKSVFSGASYQAAVAGSVMAHMVAETNLNWLEPISDKPQELLAETGGTGDDLRVLLGEGRSGIEVQAKRILQGKRALLETLSEMVERSTSAANEPIVLAVGTGSSSEITDTFANDLIHYRQGRRDLRPITLAVLTSIKDSEILLPRLRVVPADFETLSSNGTQAALANLRLVLEDPDEGEAAWDTLVSAAITLCKGGRIKKSEIESLLRARKFVLRGVGPESRWELRLDHVRELYEKDRPRTALVIAQELEKELLGKSVSARVRARLYNSLGAGLNRTGQGPAAVGYFHRALEHLSRPSTDTERLDPEYRRGPNWYDTTVNLAAGLLLSDQLDEAALTLQPLLSLQPAEAKAWGIALRLAVVQGRGLAIPTEIVNAAPVREAEGVLALDKQEWDRAVPIFRELIASGEASAHVYAWHATAVVSQVMTATSEREKASLLLEAERAGTAAIRRLEDTELDRFLVEALVARAAAREEMGKPVEAGEDYARIAAIDPVNPNLLRRRVREFLDRGDNAAALAVLTDEVVQDSINLLTFRASILAGEENEKESAARDLRAALELATKERRQQGYEHRLQIAELATRVENADLAEVAIEQTSDVSPDWFKEVLRARIAFLRSDIEKGVEWYRRAESYATNADDKERVALEFAESMYHARKPLEAVAIYKRTRAVVHTHRGFRSFIKALMRAEQFLAVATYLGELERDKELFPDVESLPEWVLRTAMDIAWRQENFPLVIHYARPLAENQQDIEAQLVLAAAHVNLRNAEAALLLLRKVVTRDDLTPEERMQAANLLHAAQAWQEAIKEAFTAWRQKPDDKQMIMNFVGVVAIDTGSQPISLPRDGAEAIDRDSTPENLPAVMPDCWVKLVTDAAPPVEYVIYAMPPVDAGRHEYLATDPQVADLVGRKLGEVIIRRPTQWNERHYRVEQILPAAVYAFRRLISEFEARFPDTPFIQQYEIGETPTLETLAPILATIRASNDYAERIWSEYTLKRLPIALVAIALGRSLAQTIAHVTSAGDRLLFVDAPDSAAFQDSVRLAKDTSRIVMTRQSFATLVATNQLDQIFDKYEVLVPASLTEELKQELDDYVNLAEKGRLGMSEQGGAFRITEVKPGEATEWLNKFADAVAKLADRGRVVMRPLTALASKDREWRENLLGPSSMDAIAVARAEEATLYSDDWGFRSVAKSEFGVSSVSTAVISTAFFEENRITSSSLDDAITTLIELNHYWIPIRPSTVVTALRKSHSAAQKVMSRLADPALHLTSAVEVAITSLRLLGLTPIVAVSLREATVLLLRVLLDGRTANDVIPVFIAHASRAFAFMPQQLNEIHRATIDVVRMLGFLPRLGGGSHG